MRPSYAYIDLNAIQHNYRIAKQLHGRKVLAVVKADAYGHGALQVCQALATEADGFAVAFIEEAKQLREQGIKQPILILEGVFDSEDLCYAAQHQLSINIHQSTQIDMIEKTAFGSPLHVWIKVNSGMNRLGFHANEQLIHAIWQRLHHNPKVSVDGFITHFAQADELSPEPTHTQLQTFLHAVKNLPGARSASNSAAILHWPDTYMDYGRAGIMLYGISPFNDLSDNKLQPAMHLRSQIFAIQSIQQGDAIGYGGTFIAPHSMRIGLVAIGYADGYPRSMPNGSPVAVDGHITQLVGRVAMDMLAIDLSKLPQVQIGGHVELWGKTINVASLASQVNTIPYELLCHIKRFPRVYNPISSED